MTVPLAGSCCQVIRDLRVIFRFHNKKKEEMSTIGRQVNHVLFTARLTLLHFDERNIEVGRVHVVRTVLMTQRPKPLRTRQ